MWVWCLQAKDTNIRWDFRYHRVVSGEGHIQFACHMRWSHQCSFLASVEEPTKQSPSISHSAILKLVLHRGLVHQRSATDFSEGSCSIRLQQWGRSVQSGGTRYTNPRKTTVRSRL